MVGHYFRVQTNQIRSASHNQKLVKKVANSILQWLNALSVVRYANLLLAIALVSKLFISGLICYGWPQVGEQTGQVHSAVAGHVTLQGTV